MFHRWGHGKHLRSSPSTHSLTSSLDSALPSDPRPLVKSRKDQRVDDALHAARLAVRAIGEFASISAHAPGVDVVMSTLERLLDTVIKARDNNREADEIGQSVLSLVNLVKDTFNNVNEHFMSPPDHDKVISGAEYSGVSLGRLRTAISQLIESLNNLNRRAQAIKHHHWFIRSLRIEQNAIILRNIRTGIDEARDNFGVSCLIRIEQGIISNQAGIDNVGRQVADVQSGIGGINAMVSSLDVKTQRLNNIADGKAIQEILNKLPHRDSAEFSSFINEAKNGYLQGTRTGLIADLENWATSDTQQPQLFILSGGAGTGKSTIAYEMARRLETQGRLGASFFFVRGDADLSTTNFVFPTIAYQLARSQLDFAPRIVDACRMHLTRGPDQQNMERQLYDLIVNPLKSIAKQHHPVVIIIDAVDECTEFALERVPRMLHLLLKGVRDLPFPLRILLTTRPELHIETVFSSVDFADAAKPFRLEEIPRSQADRDIKFFLKESWTAISSVNPKAANPEIIEQLTRRAEGLFIYATTVIRILREDPYHFRTIIDALLSDAPTETAVGLAELDKIYAVALEKAFPTEFLDRRVSNRTSLQAVFGAIALLRDHVSPSTMRFLLEVPISDTRSIIARAASVIVYNAQDSDAMRPLHASFPQFLIDENRCRNMTFYVNPGIHHGRIAGACLNLLNSNRGFCRNILGLEDPIVSKGEIVGYQARVQHSIPAHIQYACKHWATHLDGVSYSPALSSQVTMFCQTKLLVWLEALSLLNELSIAVRALNDVRKWCHIHNEIALSNLLDDAYRFVLEYFEPINDCPGQIYISGLTLMPSCHLLHAYSQGMITSLITPRDAHWGACIRVIEGGHSGAVSAVAASPRGHWITSGSFDHGVRTWNAESGDLHNAMFDHSGDVTSLCISPDSRFIASGSQNGEIYVWNVATGAPIHELHRSSDNVQITSVRAVTYSPDAGTIAAVGSAKLKVAPAHAQNDESFPRSIGFLCICNILKGSQFIRTIYANCVNSVAYSGDGSRLIVGTSEGTLCMWGTTYSSDGKTFDGHIGDVWTVVFLQDDRTAASGSADWTIRLWNTDTAECVRVLEGHTGEVNSLCVSAESNIIASGSTDCTVRLWDAQSGEALNVLQNHTNWVFSVAFSHDGTRLLSGSSDNTVRIWDLQALSAGPESMGHSSAVRCVALSDDLKYVASCGEDGAIILWDIRRPNPQTSGARSATDAGNRALQRKVDCAQGIIYRVAFSPDGTMLAAGSHSSINIWYLPDFTIRTTIKIKLKGKEWVDKLAFSPDSSKVYADFDSGTHPAIWSCETGELLEYESNDWDKRAIRFREDNGWITDRQTEKKLCWIADSKRRTFYSSPAETSHGCYYACGSLTGKVTVLDLSALV